MLQKKSLLIALALVGSMAAIMALFLGEGHEPVNFLAAKPDDAIYQKAFQKFISKYRKNYLTNEEYQSRFDIFKKNLDYIMAHNSSAYKLSINAYADWSDQERETILQTQIPKPADLDLLRDYPEVDSLSLPQSVDWRQSGAVSTVRHQGGCNGCYAFSAAGAIEGAQKIKTGKMIELSAQQLVDCTRGNGNQGCTGGWMVNVFEYLKTNKLQPWDTYPYETKIGTCRYTPSKGVVGVKSYVALPAKNPQALMDAVSKQPVSIAVNSRSSDFFFYKSGIIDSEKCPTEVNHAVLLVGYGTDAASKTDYWLVKNSWGPTWGEKGFFKVKRTMQQGVPGICGILSDHSSYPIVD